MATFTIGRSGLHKGEKSLADAMTKAMDQDIIQIRERKVTLPETLTLKPGVTIQGDPTMDAPVIVGPQRKIAMFVPANAFGTITLKHLKLQLDESSIGLRVNAGKMRFVLDDVQIYHKKDLAVAYNGVIFGAEAGDHPDVVITNSMIDKFQGIVNTIRLQDSNLGDWFDAANSQLFLNQGNISGTALQNILIAGNSDTAQLQISNSALGGNVRFQSVTVAGDTIQLDQLPIINHRGRAKADETPADATALIVGPEAKVDIKHVTQGGTQDDRKLPVDLPKWRALGILGGALTINDAYIVNTGLKNVAKGGNIAFENVTDDSDWVTESQWQSGPKLQLANRNSHSSLFDQQSKLNITGAKVYGETGQGPQQTESAIQQLDKLIGLEPVKKRVKTIISQAKASMERERRGLTNNNSIRLHQIFAGSAGTGKTTVARLVGQALYEGGVLKSTKFIEARQPDLVSQYVGKTAQKTKEVVQSALDGVLFIDEMYELAPPKQGSNFNNEAVTELIADMENYKNRLVVIGAGYTQDMKDFFARGNQGLQSRFTNWIEFPDYSPLELKQIERFDLVKSGARLANPNVVQLIDRGIDRLLPVVSRSRSTGNGRFIDNYVQKITEMRDLRIAESGDMSKLNDDQLMIIQPQDVQAAIDAMEKQLTNMM